jgi:hypothetical protein
MSRFAVSHCAAPLGLGGFIYLSWRPTGLLMFDWAEALGLGSVLAAWRGAVAPSGELVPEAVLYSLPDALWVYALTAWFSRTWPSPRLRGKWLGAGLALGVGGELGQLAGVVPGTFDPVDLVGCAAAAGAGWLAGRTGAVRTEGLRERVGRSLVAALAFGVLAAGSAESDRSIEVSMPAGGAADLQSHVEIRIANTGSEALAVDGIELDEYFLGPFELVGGEPSLGAPVEDQGKQVYPVRLEVAPGSEGILRLDVIPRFGGDLDLPIGLCFEGESSCRSARVKTKVDGPAAPLAYPQVTLPESVAVGETFQLEVRIGNPTSKEDALIDLTLNEVLKGAEVESVDPAALSAEPQPLLGGTVYTFHRPIPPRSEIVVTYHMRARQTVRIEDYVNICTESHLLCQQPEFVLRANDP